MRLSDHAGVRHGMLPGFPRDLRASSQSRISCFVLDGARNHRSDELDRSRQYHRCFSCRLIRRSSTPRKISGTKSARKSSRTTPSNPWTTSMPKARGGCTLHRTQSNARQIHHVVPLIAISISLTDQTDSVIDPHGDGNKSSGSRRRALSHCGWHRQAHAEKTAFRVP